MGGCCCHSVRRTASNGPPLYFYCPEENESFPSTHGPSPTVPVLVNPDLDTSISDSRQDPSTLPHGDSTFTQSNTGNTENYTNKSDHNQPTNTVPERDVDKDRFEGSDSCDGMKGPECKGLSDFERESPNAKEKLSNLENSMIFGLDEEDVCPICLEEFDTENPRIITKCKHDFHLSCILEWFERSNTCAICDRIMEVDNMPLFDQTF